MNTVAEIIRQEILDRGPISFARFMELALYYPNFGYYEQEAERVGRAGDFFTSVSVGSLFGELLALQFAEWLSELKPLIASGNPAVGSTGDPPVPPGDSPGGMAAPLPANRGTPFPTNTPAIPVPPAASGTVAGESPALPLFRTSSKDPGVPPSESQAGQATTQGPPPRLVQIVEAGAHDGRLATDILSWFRKHRSDLLANLTYWIMEPSIQRQAWQRKTLSEFQECVRWASDWHALEPDGVCGIVFANEFLDSFPVHRIAWDAAQARWFDWGVAWKNDEFAWCRLPEEPKPALGDPDRFPWPELSPELLAAVPDGFTTEVSLVAPAWWNQAALALQRGKLLTMDYGLSSDEFITPDRVDGTSRAYRQHHLCRDLLATVGEQDLTSHVNFTEIQAAGERAGLRTEASVAQSKFLTGIAAQIERSQVGFDKWTPARIRQLQTLIHPEHLGRSFRVLIQSR